MALAPIAGMSCNTLQSVCFLAAALLAGNASAQQVPLHPLSEVRAAAERAAESRLDAGQPGITTRATAGQLDPRLRLARCGRPLEATLPQALRDAARVTVGVRCSAPQWTVYVPVAIATEMPVLVLRQAMPRQTTLSSADVDLQRRVVPGLATAYLTHPDQLQRRHLRIAAAPGTALTADLLAADVLVRRGQRVTLVAMAGGIEVRAAGEAVADAGPDGRVRVLNLSSRRVVEGRAEAGDRVRVSL